MATQIYLGMPPANIKKWIEDHYGPKEDPMLKVPLTFTAEEAGAKISLQPSFDSLAVTLETSTTGEEGSWTPYEVGTEIILANVGDKVMFRNSSDEIQAISKSSGEGNQFYINSGKIAASGNIMFLMDKTGELRDLTGLDCNFCGLFNECQSLTQAPLLPATTLTESCYVDMFKDCTSLTKAPLILPATTLANWCYQNMFYNCTSLTQAPELPATILDSNFSGCYYMMFYNCKSLTQAPALPATSLFNQNYYYTFYNCKSPFIFPNKTFDEVVDLIQYENIIGDYWYYFDEEQNEIIINPIEIICSDKTMLATYGEDNYEWILTEK